MQTQRLRGLLNIVAIACFGAGMLVPSTPAQKRDKDTVQLKSGKPESGKIQNEDFAGISIELKPGQTKTIPWNDVQSVEYAGESALAAAMEALGSGKLEESLSQFEDMQKSGKLRPVIEQQVLYHIPFLAQRTGKLDEAIAGYKALFEAFPKGRYVRIGGENWISCLLAKADVNGAEEALAKINFGAQGTAGLEIDLALLRGRVLEAKQNWADATTSYQAAEKAAGAGTPSAMEAQLGRARCLIGSGKPGDADPILRELTKADAPNQVRSGAWNCLGELATEDGRQRRSIEQLLDALYMHLRGVVQYAPLPGESTREYERALAGAARVCRFISELEQNSERRRTYRGRYEENKAKLGKDFPSSPYLKGL